MDFENKENLQNETTPEEPLEQVQIPEENVVGENEAPQQPQYVWHQDDYVANQTPPSYTYDSQTYRQNMKNMRQEYKANYEKFGLNVVYYRKRKKLTQLQLAELVDIDRSHISAIELGNVGVSFDVLFKLCEVLEISPKQLFDFRE